MDKLFKDQPLTYTITDKYISVKQKPVELTAQKPVDVTGKVVNERGEPMLGVTVSVKGTKTATQTAEDGSFSIAVPSSNSVLVFTNVGFERLELPLNGKTTTIMVSMKAATSSLNEVIVTGYSSQRKKDITGAVSVVKVSDLLTTPSPNVTSQLQGRASGVTITNDNLPGNGAIVRIRGFASFSGQPGGNDPLYIIDGVPGDVAALNPADIESIQVLKDAASGSIYGARASNGVLIITTKRGRAGGAKITYDAYYGNQDPGKGYTSQMLNPQGNADLVWLALKNSGQPFYS